MESRHCQLCPCSMSEQGTLARRFIREQHKEKLFKLDISDVWDRNSWYVQCEVTTEWDICTVAVHAMLRKEVNWGRMTWERPHPQPYLKRDWLKNHCGDSNLQPRETTYTELGLERTYETTHLICSPQQHEWEVSSSCPLCTVDWSGSRWSTRCWEIKYGRSLKRSTVGKHIIGNPD